ncbi:carboxymuconolactone decarboxylase family protein [Rhodanobacter lycopersici]|uniref:carboxymuconolactone decarboxylase family protein n=1 Tax=Rhodanobacter lycopersici TaxID=3162487 RepID=UPI003F5AEA80
MTRDMESSLFSGSSILNFPIFGIIMERYRGSRQPQEAARMAHDPHYARDSIGDIAPKLAELTDAVLFADVWARAEISPRERSIATVSALIALNRGEQLPFHLARARDNGLSEAELVELITHLAFYAGWPCAFSAIGTLRKERAP